MGSKDHCTNPFLSGTGGRVVTKIQDTWVNFQVLLDLALVELLKANKTVSSKTEVGVGIKVWIFVQWCL